MSDILRKYLLSSVAFVPATDQGTAPASEDVVVEEGLSVAEVAAMVKSGDIKPAEYIAAFKTAKGRVPNLPREKVYEAIGLMEDDDMSLFIANVERFEAEAEDEAEEEVGGTSETTDEKPTIEDQDTLDKKAASIFAEAEFLDANDKLSTDVMAYITAPEKTKRGPALLCVDLMNDERINLDAWPRVGSKRKEGTNQPYDLYTRQANDGSTVDGSWFDDLAARTKIGQINLNMIDQLIMVRDNVEGKDPKLAELEPTKVESEIAKYKARQKAYGNLLRKAVNVYHIMCDIEEKLPNVRAAFQYCDAPNDNELYDTVKCIYVQDVKNPAKIKALYPSEFLRMDVNKAEIAGGSWTNLLDTAKKKKPNGTKANQGSQQAETKQPPLTAVDFIDWMLRGVNFVDWESDDGRKHQAEIGVAARKWSDEEVLSFGNLVTSLDAIFVRSVLQERYEALQGAEVQTHQDKASKKVA